MGFPELKTERLIFRPIDENDFELVHALWNDRGMRRYLFDDKVVSRELTLELLTASGAGMRERGLGLWGAARIGFPETIGFGGYLWKGDPVAADLHYGLEEAYFGQGYGREIAEEMLRVAFVFSGQTRITAGVDEPNRASVRLLEKIGMRFLSQDENRIQSYELTSDEWRTRNP